MPRELFLDGDKLIQKPLPELDNYRKEILSKNINASEGKVFMTGFKTNLQFSVTKAEERGQVVIKLTASQDGRLGTKLILDYDRKEIILDRSQAGAPLAEEYGSQRVLLEDLGQQLDLDIYLDRSSLEIFVNGGQEVASSRIFPGDEQVYTVIEGADAELDMTIYDLMI